MFVGFFHLSGSSNYSSANKKKVSNSVSNHFNELLTHRMVHNMFYFNMFIS